MTARRSPGAGGRRSLLAAGLAAALATFFAFGVADGLALVPASRGGAAVLRLVATLVAGLSVWVAARAPGRLRFPRRLGRLILPAWLAAGPALLALHLVFVVPIESAGGRRAGSVIAFWPPCDEGSAVECRGRSREECVKALGYRDDLIEECWGSGRVLAVELALALSSLLASGGFGGLLGVLLARRAAPDRRPPRLFICYRRADSGGSVEPLAERLSERFGAGNVFRDVEAIRLGTDFRQSVRRALSGCDVFLLVIGPGWLDASDAEGGRRLDRPDDPVRIEIESAIARGLSIVPVLVGGAPMPGRDRMPDGLEELSSRAGVALRGDPGAPGDSAFAAAVDTLIRQLEEIEGVEAPAAPGGSAA